MVTDNSTENILEKRHRGRPTVDGSGDVIAVSIHGKVVTWCENVFAGDKKLILAAKNKAEAKVLVSLVFMGPEVEANHDSALGVLASMVAINPGKAIIVKYPTTVLDYLSSNYLKFS